MNRSLFGYGIFAVCILYGSISFSVEENDKENEWFFSALRTSKFETVQEFLREKDKEAAKEFATITYRNTTQYGNATPLKIAISNGDLDLAKLLIEEYNAPIDSNSLDTAVEFRHLNVLDYLLEESTPTPQQLKDQYKKKRQELIGLIENPSYKSLLKQGVEAKKIEDFIMWTFFYAIANNQLEMVSELFKQVSWLIEKNKAGMLDFLDDTPLEIAARNGSIEMIKLLIENGSDINQQSKSQSRTALNVAVERQHPNVVAYLLEHGANPTIKNELNSPLELARDKLRSLDLPYEKASAKRIVELLEKFEKKEPGMNTLDQNLQELSQSLLALGYKFF